MAKLAWRTDGLLRTQDFEVAVFARALLAIERRGARVDESLPLQRLPRTKARHDRAFVLFRAPPPGHACCFSTQVTDLPS